MDATIAAPLAQRYPFGAGENMIRLIIGLLLCFEGIAHAELVPTLESVELQRDGKPVAISLASTLVAYAQRLFGSCSFDASETHGSVGEWSQLLGSPDYLHIKYRNEPSFTTAGKEHRIREILIPLPPEAWPSYLYGRTGDKVFACSKFNPRKLADVACNDLVGLKDTQPYIAICKEWRASSL